MSNLLDLKDKTAAVIGASSGIGRAVSLLLAEHGANVVLCARRTDKLEETAALIRVHGGRAVTVAGDAVLPETHETVVCTAQREFGGLDIAINNAGTLGAYKPLAELSPEEWRATLDGNLTAAFLGARSQIPAMLARGGGAMVFTSSFVGTGCALPTWVHTAVPKPHFPHWPKALPPITPPKASAPTPCCPAARTRK